MVLILNISWKCLWGFQGSQDDTVKFRRRDNLENLRNSFQNSQPWISSANLPPFYWNLGQLQHFLEEASPFFHQQITQYCEQSQRPKIRMSVLQAY